MSTYNKTNTSDAYNHMLHTSEQTIHEFENNANFKQLSKLIRWMSTETDSPLIKLLTAFSEPDYYPIALRLRYDEFASYLSSVYSEKGETYNRKREQIAALNAVYRTARNRIDYLDTHFKSYILRIGEIEEINPYNLPLPPDEVRIAFCAPSYSSDCEIRDIFWGLPNISNQLSTERRIKLHALTGYELNKFMKEIASEAKSNALNRFYLAFLYDFAERVHEFGRPGDVWGRDAWELVDEDRVYSDAIGSGLFAIEHPELLNENIRRLIHLSHMKR